MSGNAEQLVYQVSVDLGSSMNKVTDLRKGFEDAKKSIESVNSQEVHNIVDPAESSRVLTLSQRLAEVKKALDLISQGYSLKVGTNDIDNAEAKLRSLEKLYGDMQKSMKDGMLSNVSDQAARQNRNALDDYYKDEQRRISNNSAAHKAAWSDLDKQAEQSGAYQRKLSDQFYADEQKRMAETSANLRQQMQERERLRTEQNAGTNRNVFDDMYAEQQRKIKENSDAHRSALQSMVTSENQYERAVANVNTQISRGRQLSEDAYSKMAKAVNESKAAMEAAGGKSNIVNPLESPQYSTRNEYNQSMAQGNAAEWAQGVRSYTSEINRLRAAQEALYVTYKQNPTAENLSALSKARQGVINLSNEYQHYQSVIGNAATASDSFFGKLRSHYYWILAGGFVSAMIGVPAQMLKTIVEVDEAMHNLGTVMPSLEQSTSNLEAEQTKLIGTASQYGAAVNDVAESARLWGRMYKDVDTVNVLTSQSAKLAVADNFSMAESTKAVEAAMFQFGMTAKTSAEALAYSNKIVDTYTALSHQAGVSAQDLASGVERSGAAASQAGVDFEFLTALIAQGTRATALSGSNVGDMLKTLFASIHSKKAVEELNKLGIAVENVDSNGVKHFRRVQDVLLDVAVVAQGTNNNLQNLFQQMSGGRPKLAA